MSNLEWRAIFTIEPGLQRPEIINGYHFQVEKNGSAVVVCTYETGTNDEQHPQAASRYEYAEQTLARLDSDKLREIMLRRMIYQKSFTRLDVELKGKVDR